MAEGVENEEKNFEHFLELPTKVRRRMIDKMGTKDRCRLTRCSKRCNQEVKASKQYIYGLRFHFRSEEWMRIEVKYQQFGYHGYSLLFSERSGKKSKAYKSLDLEPFYEVELDKSLDLFQSAFEEFREILQTYQNMLKMLDMTDSRGQIVGQTFDYGIKSLNSLERLSIWGAFDAVQILSKIQHPLKYLYLRGEDNEQLVNCEQLYQVRDQLTLWDVQLRNENFLRLSAKNVEIGIGKLTETDIFKFIRSWQDGTIGKEFELYWWSFNESSFDKKKLFRLLRLGDQVNRFIEIKHFNEHGKTARLVHSHDVLQFYDDSNFAR